MAERRRNSRKAAAAVAAAAAGGDGDASSSSDGEEEEARPRTLSKPTTTSEAWQRVAQPHVDSFNFMLEEGLDMAVANLPPVEIPLYDPLQQQKKALADGSDNDSDGSDDEDAGNRNSLSVWIDSAMIGYPTKSDDSTDQRIFPAECRERHISYSGALNVVVNYSLNGGPVKSVSRKVGDVPIMVGSRRCHTAALSPVQKVAHHEDASSFGGYFITNGIERCIRMLQIPKRNFVHVLSRNAYLKRGTECVVLRIQSACCFSCSGCCYC